MTFPNATHWVSEKQWKNFINPNLLEENTYFLADMMAVHKTNKLKLISADTNLCKGVDLKLFDGHTEGQIAIYINGKSKTAVYTGDIVPTSANIGLDWLSAYDINKLDAILGKLNILNEAAEKNHLIIFADRKSVV